MPQFVIKLSQEELDAICEMEGYPKGDRKTEDAIMENIVLDGIMENTAIPTSGMSVSRG